VLETNDHSSIVSQLLLLIGDSHLPDLLAYEREDLKDKPESALRPARASQKGRLTKVKAIGSPKRHKQSTQICLAGRGVTDGRGRCSRGDSSSAGRGGGPSKMLATLVRRRLASMLLGI
jgi:hypothetical protein